MQGDFHYYGTYCAALLAGYHHEDALEICHSAQLVDHATVSYLDRLGAPSSAATTQRVLEFANARTDIPGLQDITRIWASFHFLPRDLDADPGRGGRRYRNKYRLICGPNGPLVSDTVELAKGESLQAVGIAMHVVADTWAHRNFAGTPSLAINNINSQFIEIIIEDGAATERPVTFRHNPTAPDDFENSVYTNTPYQMGETSIINLGHGRAGHLPDYSFARYRYLPAWNDYEEYTKDNPSDFYHAFCQMVHALRYLRGDVPSFVTDTYDFETVAPHEDEIRALLEVRRHDAADDWKALGERLSGQEIPDFDLDAPVEPYRQASEAEKGQTPMGRFIVAALAHKSMVTNRIHRSGNNLAGRSRDFDKRGFGGIKDFRLLLERVTGADNANRGDDE